MLISRGNRVRSALLPALPALFLLAAIPAGAQSADPKPDSAKKAQSQEAPAMEEEIIVTGRHGEPDFQEQNQFHIQEYRRLKQIYDPDPLPVIRSDRLVRMPEATSSTVQGKPTLTEKQW